MAIGLGALASGYTGSMSDFYRMMIEQELQRRNQANQYDLSYQNWQKQQQYLQQQNAPLLQRQQAWQQLQEFEQTYPQQQILGNPALQSHWQQLRTQAGVPLATGPQGPGTMQQVGIPTGTGPGLATVGTQQPIGPQSQMPILPQRPLRRTLSDYDPRFGGTVFAATPLPITATGEVDSAGLERYYKLAKLSVEEKPKEPFTPAQLNTVWQQSVNQSGFEILGKRGSGLSFGPDGQIVLAAGQPPLTQQEVDAINRRAQEIYAQRVARSTGRPIPGPPPPVPIPMTRNEMLRRQAAAGLPSAAAQPAIGAPPVTSGVPTPPARAIGAPPTAPARTPAPTSRAQAVLGIWTQQKIPVPKVRWDSLTAVERAWLTSQGVTSGK